MKLIANLTLFGAKDSRVLAGASFEPGELGLSDAEVKQLLANGVVSRDPQEAEAEAEAAAADAEAAARAEAEAKAEAEAEAAAKATEAAKAPAAKTAGRKAS